MINMSDTQKTILTTLRRHPDITTAELKDLLPNLTSPAVHTAVSELKKLGWVKVTGHTYIKTAQRGFLKCNTYAAKYTHRRATEAPQAEIIAKTVTTVMPHVDEKLKAAYELLAALHTETMAELELTKKRLEEAEARRNWWDAVKEWFA